jgi:formate hydrogenlyase transcriptional activator
MYPSGIWNFDSDQQRRAALLALIEVISRPRDPAELLGEVVPYLQSAVRFDLLTFALYDSSQNVMKMYLWVGVEEQPAQLEVAVDESIAGSVWRNQTPTCIDDLKMEKQFETELQWLRAHKLHSYCVLPVTNFREKLGVLGLANKRTAAFTVQDISFLHRAAELLAVSVDRSLSDEVRDQEARRMRLLLAVGGLSPARDLRHLLDSFLEHLQKWALDDYVGVYLYDEAAQALRLYMSDSELAEKMAPQGMAPIEGSLAGQAFRSRRSVLLDHSNLAGIPFDSVKRGIELGVRSLYLCPLTAAEEPVGVLKVARREGYTFSQREIEVLEEVAKFIAPLLERAGSEILAQPEKPTSRGKSIEVARTSMQTSGERPRSDSAPQPIDADHPPPFPAPEALMESEQLLTAYFKASKVGLCILDTDLRFLAVNDTLAEMNGMTAAAHLGKSVREVLGDFAQVVEPQLRRVLASGQPISDLEVSFMLSHRAKPGHWLEHFIPIKDATGKVTRIGAVVVETTEQKKLEESLRDVHETLRQEKKRQHVLTEVSRLLATKWEMRKAFPQVSAYLRRILRQEYAALALREEDSGQLVSQALDFPLGKSLTAGGEIAAGGAGGRALQERSSLIFGAEEMQEFDPSYAASLTSEGLKSLCCVPLLRPKGPLGVLILGSTRAEAFHSDDLTLLNQVAAQLAISLENAAIAREVEQLRQRLNQEKRNLQGAPRTAPQFKEIIGDSAALQQILDQVSVIAATDATVLILGETGTGKGLVARAIHAASNRKDRSFTTLNCAAIPTGLLESELFGHEKGAFTGAVSQKIGRLEMADKGTLFLDEIGEISLELQPKLLRVLQDFEFERLGGTRTIKVDLRLIAATNQDMTKSVAQKQFRSDLFYRLNVFPLRLPSLRERREDIPQLVRYFVQEFSSGMGREIETIPNETMEALIRSNWPGNIRELENFIERSVILSDGPVLRVPLDELRAEASRPSEQSLERTEREHILRVLRETRGVISGPLGAAHRLGLKRTTLQSMMQRLGITSADYSNLKRN